MILLKNYIVVIGSGMRSSFKSDINFCMKLLCLFIYRRVRRGNWREIWRWFWFRMIKDC